MRHKGVTRKEYRRAEKIKAVMDYRSTGNLTLAAKNAGCNRNALRRWIEEFSDVEAVDACTSNAYVRAIENFEAVRLTFLREHYDALSEVIQKGIAKADELIVHSTKLTDVVTAIKELSSIIKEFTPSDETNPGTTINLLQQTVNKEK
ncbi:MAG: transposase [Bacteroidales bacterium]|nr:transposase [Bacteroidales bacterium]